MAGLARPRWGWHRLGSSSARRLVAGAGIGPGDLVLDVGAGTGAVTDALVRAGARVIAFELHRGRARHLRAQFAGRAVKVVHADITDLWLPRRPFHVVANPPFALVDPLLGRLMAPGSLLRTADLVVPRHSARKWTEPGAPGSRRWGATFELSYGLVVPRSAFIPPPPRDARVLKIRRIA